MTSTSVLVTTFPCPSNIGRPRFFDVRRKKQIPPSYVILAMFTAAALAGPAADMGIITGADGGVGGHVKVFDGTSGTLLQSFFAYDGFSGGVRVAAGDLNGDGFDDIITGAGPGGVGGHVKVFDGTSGTLLQSFFAYDGFNGGVFVSSEQSRLVPEPGTAALLGVGVMLLGRRKK